MLSPGEITAEFRRTVERENLLFSSLVASVAYGRTFRERFVGNPKYREPFTTVTTVGDVLFPISTWTAKDMDDLFEPYPAPLDLWVGQSWVMRVFSQWEEVTRPKLARTRGVQLHQIASDVMGDLRNIRNDIVHHRAVASKDNCGRLKVLNDWVAVGYPIEVVHSHVADFLIKFEWEQIART
ncbi:hypothetical protein [Subtercola sp. YIM 133946]|uniref:hypothetical protein n=1 Tax=Subtercola sp. YIM 133946 TaxID=3118909 RepID=UPI002F94AD37